MAKNLAVEICKYIFRVAGFLALLIVGSTIQAAFHGMQFYALVEEGPQIGPYCRLLVYDFEKDGRTKILFEKTIGAWQADAGVDLVYGLEVPIRPEEIQHTDEYDDKQERIEQGIMTKAEAYGVSTEEEGDYWVVKNSAGDPIPDPDAPDDERLDLIMEKLGQFKGGDRQVFFPGGADEHNCPLQVTQVGQYYDKPRVMIHNLRTQKQLEMSEECGGSEPGSWLDYMSDSQGGGMNSAAPILSLVAYFVARVFLLTFDLCLSALDVMGLKDNPLVPIYKVMEPLIGTIFCGFWIAPTANLEYHAECPYLITTVYSSALQQAFWYGSLIVIFCSCCCFPLAALEKVPKECPMYGTASGLGIAGLASFIGGVWIYVVKQKWWGFLGFAVNLEMYFPGWSIAEKINTFHILQFCILLSDFLAVIVNIYLVVAGAKGDS